MVSTVPASACEQLIVRELEHRGYEATLVPFAIRICCPQGRVESIAMVLRDVTAVRPGTLRPASPRIAVRVGGGRKVQRRGATEWGCYNQTFPRFGARQAATVVDHLLVAFFARVDRAAARARAAAEPPVVPQRVEAGGLTWEYDAAAGTLRAVGPVDPATAAAVFARLGE